MTTIEWKLNSVIGRLVEAKVVDVDWKLRRAELKRAANALLHGDSRFSECVLLQTLQADLQALRGFDDRVGDVVTVWQCEQAVRWLRANFESERAKSIFGAWSATASAEWQRVIDALHRQHVGLADALALLAEASDLALPAALRAAEIGHGKVASLRERLTRCEAAVQESASVYARRCAALGIAGVDVDGELRSLAATRLPELLRRFDCAVRSTPFADALRFYALFAKRLTRANSVDLTFLQSHAAAQRNDDELKKKVDHVDDDDDDDDLFAEFEIIDVAATPSSVDAWTHVLFDRDTHERALDQLEELRSFLAMRAMQVADIEPRHASTMYQTMRALLDDGDKTLRRRLQPSADELRAMLTAADEAHALLRSSDTQDLLDLRTAPECRERLVEQLSSLASLAERRRDALQQTERALEEARALLAQRVVPRCAALRAFIVRLKSQIEVALLDALRARNDKAFEFARSAHSFQLIL
jgi:CDK5 regulatory subunit-associated protein 3